MTWYASTKMGDVSRSYETPKYPFHSAVAKQFVEETTDFPDGEHEILVQEGLMGPVETFKVSVIRQVYVRRAE